MDTAVVLPAIITATMCAISFHAWRIGSEKVDAALLGTAGGLRGVGATIAAVI